MAWQKQGGTKHKAGCSRVWRHYDPTCPRCIELSEGATPREGWGQSRTDEAERIEAIRTHDFAACARKNIICTCFDS